MKKSKKEVNKKRKMAGDADVSRRLIKKFKYLGYTDKYRLEVEHPMVRLVWNDLESTCHIQVGQFDEGKDIPVEVTITIKSVG